MSVPVDEAGARAVLLDIEGTTTPIEFVYQVLFPYARTHVKKFLQQHQHSPDVCDDLEELQEECARDLRRGLEPPPWQDDSEDSLIESVVEYVGWLIERDRKSTALKSLQGKIWQAGYRSGELRSEVYADVPPALSRWRKQQREIAIFSSGSVLAQKLLFAHTAAGDLTRFLKHYFDTATGAKTEAESYRRIATALGLPGLQIIFLSDVATELDAAHVAGMQTALCVRPGRPQPDTTGHSIVRSFDEIYP